MKHEERFALLCEQEREVLIKAYMERIKEEFLSDDAPNPKDGVFKYEVVLQNCRYITYITDEELENAAGYALDILEEMKIINNSGMDKKALLQVVSEAEASIKDEIVRTLHIWSKIANDKINNLIAKIERMQRVGGAYALLITRPVFISALYSVFDAVVDRFDDEDWYCSSGFFLLRAILKIRSEEVEG